MRFFPEKNKFNPYVITFCVSLFLSYLAVSTDNLLNHDAILFMNSAKIYLRDGFSALLKAFSWPLYPWMVAVLHQLSPLPHIEQTAHFINALLLSVVCVLFIRVYAEVTDHGGSLWVAAILVLTFVGINKYRADVMKDFGYWLTYLAGFYCLLRYYKRPGWLAAIGWQLFTIIAFLFRIEGIVIILLGPLAIFIKNISFKDKVSQLLPLYGVYIIGLVVAGVALLFVDFQDSEFQLGRLVSLPGYLNISGLLDSYDSAVSKIGEIFFYEGERLSKYYGLLAAIYAVVLMTYVSLKIISCISFPYFFVFLYGAYKKYFVINDSNKVVIYFILFLFLFFYVYMIKGPVLTPRYTTPLVFMLLLLLGQIVERVWPRLNNFRHGKKIAAAVFIYLFVSTVDSVISTQGDSKTYVLDAGYWVKEYTAHTVPVHSNYYKTLYYTDRDYSLQKRYELDELVGRVESDRISSGSILMFHIQSEDSEAYIPRVAELDEQNKIEFLQKFMNGDNDGIAIYRVK